MDEEIKLLENESLHDELICTLCENLLSVPPIFYSEELGQICGRCTASAKIVQDESTFKRQCIYESVAQYMVFPCCNRKYGCDVDLKWGEVKHHEDICRFQKFVCPLHYKGISVSSCGWSGNSLLLNEHMEKTHQDLVIQSEQINLLEIKSNSLFLTRVGMQLVLILLKYEEQKIFFLLMINGTDVESECYRYQLELLDDTKQSSVLLRKNRLEPYRFSPEFLDNIDNMLEVDLDKIKDILKYKDSLYGKFGIVKKSKKEISLIKGCVKDEPINAVSTSVDTGREFALNEELLGELECPICNEFMVPPIYICQTGHSFCNDCRTKVTVCPSCKSHMEGMRNYTLEKFTTRVYYPCRNRELGCLYIATSDKIQIHDIDCELSGKVCILNCNWKGTASDMIIHLKSHHHHDMIECSKLQEKDLKSDNISFYAVYVDEQIFRFSMKHSKGHGPIQVNMQHLGMSEDNPKYRFQFQLVDLSSFDLSLNVAGLCDCVSENPTHTFKSCISLPFDLLQPYISNKLIRFKIEIYKI